MKTWHIQEARLKKVSRSNDAAREVVDAMKRRSPSAQALVKKLPEEYQGAAFGVLDAGGLTLLEVQALEFAHHEKLGDMLGHYMVELADGVRVASLIASLVSVQLQSRKHLRTIAMAMNPGVDALNIQPPVSRELLEQYMTDDDFGDDLVN
jgi:hypothetical protein